MKKQIKMIVALVMLLSFVLCYRSVNASDTINADVVDDYLLEFMQANGLSENAMPLEYELDLIYECDKENDTDFSFTGDPDIIWDSYGMAVNMHAYSVGENAVHVFLDIRFDEDAEIGSRDMITIHCADNVFPDIPDLNSLWLLQNSSGEVIAQKDVQFGILDGGVQNHSVYGFGFSGVSEFTDISGPQRLLVYFSGKSESVDTITKIPLKSVVWKHMEEDTPNALLAPGMDSVEIPVIEKLDFPWKPVLLAVVTIFDVVVLVVVILAFKKKKTHSVESEMSMEEEVTPAQEESLNLKSDEIEYLREIGYFDSKSSKGRDKGTENKK